MKSNKSKLNNPVVSKTGKGGVRGREGLVEGGVLVDSPDSPGFSGEMVTKGSEGEQMERESKTVRSLCI